MFGTLNSDAIEEVFKEQSIGRIGCHANGKTYVVPVSYVYDGKHIYCHAHEGMKINMMRLNPQVCFEADASENSVAWKSVIAWGQFEEISDEEERSKALKIILNRELPFMSSKTMKMELGAHYPFAPDDLNNIGGIVFRIRLEEKTGRYAMNDGALNYLNG